MKKISFIFGLFTAACLHAQDPQFSQYFNAPIYLNPAYTGVTAEHRFTANYRNQWPGLKSGYSTYMASYDYNIDRYNMGVGGYIMQDVAGKTGLVTTQGALNYAYRIRTGEYSKLIGGLSAGFGQKRVDPSKLVFGDQFITGAAVSEDASNIGNKQYVDLGAGVLYDADNFWMGFSTKHLNKPDVGLAGGTQQLPILSDIHGGYRFVFAADSSGKRVLHSLSFLAHYRHERTNDQVDVGLNYNYRILFAGMWYRGLPLKRFAVGYSNNECLSLMLGVQIPNQPLKITYSFDYTISTLGFNKTTGAHEISLVYEPIQKKKRTIKRSDSNTKIREKF